MERVIVQERVESDYQPVTVWIRAREQRERKEERRGVRRIWSDKEREEFIRRFGKRGAEGKGVDEKWEEGR